MDGKKSTAPVDTAKQQPHQHNAPIRLLQYGKPPGQYPLLSHPHQHQYYPQYNRPGYNPLNQQQIWVPHQPPVHYHQQQPQPKAEAPKPAPQRPRDAERKKGGQQLRSPVAKRPPQAPVTMQGWLHKQGSEGLMLWKKRWFVLSEYCLFYYKGAEEEKLLGSILLPSYRVSVCGPEDKVNRKYAFKCEHDNMRTYILAADSQELMTKWVQLLNAACLLQNPCDLVPQQGHQEYSIHTHSSSNVSSPSQQELTQYTPQPLYANAPPKPRRLNGNFPPDAPTLRYIRPIYTQDVYMRKRPEIVPQAPRYNYNTERRTPDTYGRSKHYPGDYEDIYTEQMYKRPVSPLAAYTTQTRRTVPTLPQLQRTHLEITIPQPRPHSADFLEYEISRQRPQRQQQPRPKSSLDINRNVPNDSYFYSEQRYAENMRKSAQYLQVRKPEQDRTIPLSRSNTQPLRFEPPDGPRCRSVLSEGSLSKELDEDAAMAQTAPHRQIPREYDQFTRSASARMAHNERGEGLAISREGEKKREESMKRLLEWKQRMLQSPLNRKVSQGGVRNVDYLGRVQMSVPEKTAAAAAASSSSFSQYNSYSSDDEERSKEKPQTQAGRTSDLFPTVSESRTITPASPITATCTDDTLTEPLKLLGKQPSHLAQISSLRSEFSEKFEKTPTVTEIKSNGALVKSILAEFEKPPNETARESCRTPTNPTATEENYITMTPKKTPQITTESEENPYMEMNQSAEANKSIQQPYEAVYFTGNKTFEPVYMEVEKKQPKLPDVLPDNQDNSDSSDADDEASKDLNSLDTPSHPRFSLSDSFRPASYYLGASQITQELQDSSDSELVSPPPIPNNDESITSNFSQKEEPKSFFDGSDQEIAKAHHDYENMYVEKNSSLLPLSVCSTPVSREMSSYFQQNKQAAPYYYSDLSMNASPVNDLTLNNQRSALSGSKRDITRIINPIRCVEHERLIGTSVSGFKLAAEARSASVDFLNLADKSGQIDKKNIYESDTLKRLKAIDSITSLQSNPETRNLFLSSGKEKFDSNENNVRRSHSLEGLLENVLVDSTSQGNSKPEELDSELAEGSYLWEEDSVWQERLRTASQRHTRSLDDLDCVGEAKTKKQTRGITRMATYVNDNVYNMPKEEAKKTKENFTIDREKLRQWDFMSSAPSEGQAPCLNKAGVEAGAFRGSGLEQASGSISLNPRKSYPRKNMWYPPQNRSNPNFAKIHESNFKSGLRNPVGHHVTTQQNFDLSKGSNQSNSGMNVSAGELLGRTHEELVLLLIQLRRQSTNTCHAIEACYNEIDSIQAQLHLMDQAKRLENLQKLEQIKQHLLELEKQYEKGKPLVNLVDNMVKLGSLYRSPADRYNPYVRDKLEFNQSIQERRLLTEEKRDWNRLKSNHTHLQEKVQELYQLDRLIQEESGTLRGLQRDKEEIEHALGDLRRRINEGLSDPAEMEQARRQQMALENELSRVHSMLAENSKKLEETVAGNARLEQKLLLLKQKLQVARQQRSSPQFSNQGDSLACFGGNSSILESDLQRVQQRVGDLQRQRQELSMKVRQLMDRSNNLQNQIRLSSKRKVQSVWRETDLDTMSIVDHGESHSPSVPLYINTDLKQVAEGQMKSSDSTSDEMLHNSKQEIKTVRIVKRESERRHRDREKTVGNKWDLVLEEDDSSQSSVLFCPSQPVQKAQSTTMISETAFDSVSLPRVYSDGRLTSSTEESLDKSELSPVFKSEAARQIITEMSIQETPKLLNRRVVPKEKRRHYTAPHNNLIMKSLNQLPTEESSFDKSMDKRARDDLDMERALRQRIDAPDVVRSTLSNTELKYNENTIDTILGTPNKIRIPERYIPEQLPQLSAEEQEHRLRKVESIKKMLSGTIVPSSNTANFDDKGTEKTETNLLANKATSKMIEEKKQREHLLQLNQILAKQVMEMSKIIAVKALAALPLQQQQPSTDEEDLSPVTPLPLYQQRDNFYS